MRRGSALIVALWVIAVLAVMVVSFSYEAKQQAGINVYLRERNRVNRLIDAGQALAEVVISGYKDVTEYSEDENLEDLLKDDRWIREKRALKESKCTIGPIVLDEEHPENGTISCEIELVNAGAEGAININELYAEGDQNYQLRWEIIFRNLVGIPEDFEVDVEDVGRVKLTDYLIATWNDWRDQDDQVTSIENRTCGAEADWYEEEYEDKKVDDEDKRSPRNGAIPDVRELSYIRGWREPAGQAVLLGGALNPEEKDEKEQIRVKGLMSMNLFGTTGSSKINVNNCTVEQLLTVPGIASEDEDDDEESHALAQAIVDTLKLEPEHRDDYDKNREWWPYKDWNDLIQRVQDADQCDKTIGNDAQQYLIFGPDENSIFKLKIVGESMGMKREVNAECYVKDKKVRYIKWRED